jgi:hypothetical protein
MEFSIPYGIVCPWPQKLRHLAPRKKHRNRIRVNVRSFVDGHILRTCSELEARAMCAEDSFGDPIEGLQACARRLSRKKQPLTDIKLLNPKRDERNSPCTITRAEMENNAFVHEGARLSAKDSMRALDRAVSKIEAWPEVHDDRNVVISAGRAFGVITQEIPEQLINFA